MPGRSDKGLIVAQAIICVLMIGGATVAHFPNPVPLLFGAGALGSLNAMFALMRTFGSALLGGVATASVALAGMPYITCSSGRFGDVFPCTGNSPTWHLTGSVIAAGLAGAGLVLARSAATARLDDRLAAIERHLTEVREPDPNRDREPNREPDPR